MAKSPRGPAKLLRKTSVPPLKRNVKKHLDSVLFVLHLTTTLEDVKHEILHTFIDLFSLQKKKEGKCKLWLVFSDAYY